MAFSQATITRGPDAEDDEGSTLVSWDSSDSDGVTYQLYENRVLAWHGTARRVTLPRPAGRAVYQVGTVLPDEANTDFSADLPALQGTGDRARLSWLGGLWETPDPDESPLVGFDVYGEPTAGAGVDYATALDFVPRGVPTVEADGFGIGPFGTGPFGFGSGRYWWTSDPLTNGTWTFGVRPIDEAGNEGTTQEFAVTIAIPPAPPARDATTGLRLSLTYSAGTHKATLSWLASPG